MLSPRLKAVAELVPECERVVDIGTDHAFLPIHLVNSGLCAAAVAADKRSGPLKKARANIESAGLAEKIELMLSDGLDDIAVLTDDVIVLAGMGGLEMIRILDRAGRDYRCCVLQPMKSLPELRQWLGQNKLRISSERLVCERGRWYVSLRAEPAPVRVEYDDLQVWAGPCLMESKSGIYSRYLSSLQHRLQKKARGDKSLEEVAHKLNELLTSIGPENLLNDNQG